MKQPAPRCPKCGKVPPIRKRGEAEGTITYQCCGRVFVIEVETLAEDVKLTTDADAA